MPNPILALIEKHAGPDFVPRLKGQVIGLIEDFWKNPACEFPVIELKLAGRSVKLPNLLKPMPYRPVGAMPAAKAAPVAAAGPAWHALPGELSEKMWGEGHMLPAGDFMLDMLVGPLGLSKTTTMLDLAAGLGGPLHRLAGQVSQLKGFEADLAIAARGMELLTKSGKAKLASIEPYNPIEFTQPATFDAVMARELFYRIADKPKFFYSIAACLKPQGQVAFTDYIVDPENRAKAPVATWQDYEKDAKPFGLIEMAEAWAKVGFEMRVSEDQTVFYKREIAAGLGRLVAFLRQGPRPDTETKNTILRTVETWVRRMAALEQGMKFYRFHGVKS